MTKWFKRPFTFRTWLYPRPPLYTPPNNNWGVMKKRCPMIIWYYIICFWYSMKTNSWHVKDFKGKAWLVFCKRILNVCWLPCPSSLFCSMFHVSASTLQGVYNSFSGMNGTQPSSNITASTIVSATFGAARHIVKSIPPMLSFRQFPMWVFPKIGVPPNHPLKNWVFAYKPSILGYHYFWKHPCRDA